MMQGLNVQSNEEATISVHDTHDVQCDWQQPDAKHSAAAANSSTDNFPAALLEFRGGLSQQIEG
jgi:hypothetical protein